MDEFDASDNGYITADEVNVPKVTRKEADDRPYPEEPDDDHTYLDLRPPQPPAGDHVPACSGQKDSSSDDQNEAEDTYDYKKPEDVSFGFKAKGTCLGNFQTSFLQDNKNKKEL